MIHGRRETHYSYRIWPHERYVHRVGGTPLVAGKRTANSVCIAYESEVPRAANELGLCVRGDIERTNEPVLVRMHGGTWRDWATSSAHTHLAGTAMPSIAGPMRSD